MPIKPPAIDHIDPWDRLDGEPSRAYYWFNRFRELPPNERSHARLLSDATTRTAQQQPQTSADRIPSRSQLRIWSSRWRWEARVAAYDQHLERLKRANLEDEILEASRRHALQLRLAANVMAFPLQEFWRRATDPEQHDQLVEEFRAMTGPQLAGLAGSIVRALPVLQQAEREALGIAREVQPREPLVERSVGEDDDMTTAARLYRVLEALDEAGYAPARSALRELPQGEGEA
jgi:hypothetical protein